MLVPCLQGYQSFWLWNLLSWNHAKQTPILLQATGPFWFLHSYIQQLKVKCLRALDLLKVLSHSDRGADKETLLMVYHSLIWSKLDYGCMVYGSACQTNLGLLDPVHTQPLRICLGAFPSSPRDSLCVEADEPPFALHRTKLALWYCLNWNLTPPILPILVCFIQNSRMGLRAIQKEVTSYFQGGRRGITHNLAHFNAVYIVIIILSLREVMEHIWGSVNENNDKNFNLTKRNQETYWKRIMRLKYCFLPNQRPSHPDKLSPCPLHWCLI